MLPSFLYWLNVHFPVVANSCETCELGVFTVIGYPLIRRSIIPQLSAQKISATLWMLFLRHLHLQMTVTRNFPSADILRKLITNVVTEVVQNFPAFPRKVTKDGHRRTYSMNSPAIFSLVRFCVDTDNVPCCGQIFANMRDAVRRGEFGPIYPPWQYYTQLCTDLIQYLGARPELEATFRPFFVDAIEAMLSRGWTTSAGVAVDPCHLIHYLSTLTMAAKKAGGISVLKER
jgi:hypothetical protein